MSSGGVPLETHHRPRRPGRPDLVVLCDVSGSVAGFAGFTLMLVFALREQFNRVKDPTASGGVAFRLNLPPNYLLIHRVWLGGIAVLSQLNARAAFGSVLEEFLPGYAPDA